MRLTPSDWASRVSSYTYQASGLVSTVTYPDGLRATDTYDRARRLTQLTNAVGATTVSQDTYTLDAEGNRTALDEFVQGITGEILSRLQRARHYAAETHVVHIFARFCLEPDSRRPGANQGAESLAEC